MESTVGLATMKRVAAALALAIACEMSAAQGSATTGDNLVELYRTKASNGDETVFGIDKNMAESVQDMFKAVTWQYVQKGEAKGETKWMGIVGECKTYKATFSAANSQEEAAKKFAAKDLNRERATLVSIPYASGSTDKQRSTCKLLGQPVSERALLVDAGRAYEKEIDQPRFADMMIKIPKLGRAPSFDQLSDQSKPKKSDMVLLKEIGRLKEQLYKVREAHDAEAHSPLQLLNQQRHFGELKLVSSLSTGALTYGEYNTKRKELVLAVTESSGKIVKTNEAEFKAVIDLRNLKADNERNLAAQKTKAENDRIAAAERLVQEKKREAQESQDAEIRDFINIIADGLIAGPQRKMRMHCDSYAGSTNCVER